MGDIRKYMMRHKIKILHHAGKKKFIEHLEDGYVGNKDVGYKKVKAGDRDIVLTRVCRHFDDMEYTSKISHLIELIIQFLVFVCYNLIFDILIGSSIQIKKIGGELYAIQDN